MFGHIVSFSAKTKNVLAPAKKVAETPWLLHFKVYNSWVVGTNGTFLATRYLPHAVDTDIKPSKLKW